MSLPLLFSTFKITGQVFYQSKLSLGLVNLKPLTPGHVLVIPRRVIPRFGELTPAEVTDLFMSAQLIGKVVEKHYNGQSLTIAIQDGPYAGQSVPHVHVHVIPRFASDFTPLDDIYPALAKTNLAADLAATQSQTHPAGGVAQSLPAAAALAPAGLVPKPGRGAIGGPDVEERRPRSRGEMEREARELAGLMPEGCRGEF